MTTTTENNVGDEAGAPEGFSMPAGSIILHDDLPMAEYLALPAASASLVKTLIDQCALAAYSDSWLNPDRVSDFSDATDLGTLSHSLVLEGGLGKVCVINPEDYPAATTGAIPKGWTNKAIQTARDEARGNGLIPVLPWDIAKAKAVAGAVSAFIGTLQETEPAIWAAFQPGGGDPEMTITWTDPIGDTPCKIRPDLISTDRRLIVDLKTTATSANPAAWARTQMINQNAYVSSAFYRRGCKAAFNTEPDYVFLIVEVEPPYLCSLVGTDPHGFALGEEKVLAGLDQWSQCVRKQFWPAYPNRVCYPELPAWVDAAWQERQQGYEYDMDVLRGVKTK